MESLDYPIYRRMSHEMSDYDCPICPTDWTMAAFDGPGTLDLGDEIIEIKKGVVYLVCPSCGTHIPEENYEDLL